MPQAPLDPKPFFRTFSYREVLSAVMATLFLLATTRTLSYLDLEVSSAVIGGGAFLLVICLHVFYRLEHRRSNNLVGRVIHDHLYLMVLYLIVLAVNWYTSGEPTFPDIGGLEVLGIWMTLAMLEGFVVLLRIVFEYAGWRIL